MEPEEYKKTYQLESTHWWFVSKRRLVNNFLSKLKFSNEPYILDIGCGTGGNLKLFSRYGKAIGIDISPFAMKFSSMRGCSRLAMSSIDALPFKNNIFDVVVLLDVLYHRMISEDRRALFEVYRIVKEGGRILITDCALEFLRSPHDEAVHGKRRYNKKALRQIVLDSGFKIEKLTYTVFFLFPFVFIIRLWKRFSVGDVSSSDLKPVHLPVNYILLAVQNFERFLLNVINLPIGSSVLCIARK